MWYGVYFCMCMSRRSKGLKGLSSPSPSPVLICPLFPTFLFLLDRHCYKPIMIF